MVLTRPLALQALAHGATAVLLLCVVLIVDSVATGDIALYLGATWAFLTGLGLGHIIHEWCHFLAAAATGATLSLKSRVHPLFFDFDMTANSSWQFLCLSMGGLFGNALLLILVMTLAEPQSLVMTALLAAAAGQLIFVVILELPISLRVIAGGAPLETLTTHFDEGGPLFLRAASGGALTAAMVFLFH